MLDRRHETLAKAQRKGRYKGRVEAADIDAEFDHAVSLAHG
jgi:hypothetical protein